MEFGHLPEESFPGELFGRATREIYDYGISLSVDQRSSGSGTLVVIHGKHGILTAAHVADDLLAAEEERIAIVCTDHAHRLLAMRAHTKITRFGPDAAGADVGPDIAFIELLDPTTVSTLAAKKSFYPLSNSGCPCFDAVDSKPTATCCVVGAPAEFSSEEGLRGTESYVLQHIHFAGRTQVMEETTRGEFDYLKVAVIAGRDDFPQRYNGISGGGVWHIPFAMNPDIGPSTLTYQRLELVGVAFYQSELIDESRMITCHGPKSLYDRIVNRVLQ